MQNWVKLLIREEAAMDKRHHPIVIQPWKIPQTQRTKRDVPQVNMGKEHGRLAPKAPNTVTLKKAREQDSKKKSQIPAHRRQQK